MSAPKSGTLEDEQLKLKFHSLAHTAPKRTQIVQSVPEEKRTEAAIRSYQTWKRINAAYFEEPMETTARQMQQYDEKDYKQVNRDAFRMKNRDTEFVEFSVRDKALARKWLCTVKLMYARSLTELVFLLKSLLWIPGNL